MGLNKNVLGNALYDFRQIFNEKTLDELLELYGTIENVRLQYAIGEADVIINHIKTDGTIPGTGLSAPNGPVTGNAKMI